MHVCVCEDSKDIHHVGASLSFLPSLFNPSPCLFLKSLVLLASTLIYFLLL